MALFSALGLLSPALTIRAGRDPLVLEQLLLLRLPSEFKFQALLVLFVFGENAKYRSHPNITAFGWYIRLRGS